MSSPKSAAANLLLAGAFVLVPGAASAYLDPGTGSYFLQILLAGLVAGLFALKVFWARLVGLFGSIFGKRGSGKSSDD